ncbi:LPO_1073/Vpar_1526 family protein [Nitrosomonas sp.]|uniref:LPO_1073/Vpar_1526 family protein n=1 Tax=Nitrosomonas sp. TaxID=42353 RepID=UPI0025E3BC3E|nr:LPO_1073/Vpar_1526 family protein [Nitrosomonas sp.]
MFNNSKELVAGNDSLNVQAGVIKVGLTYSECKEIFLDLFNANFPKLLEQAGRIAHERAEYISQKIFLELFNRNPQSIIKFSQPDLQCDLLTVQREYARQGNIEIGDLLVELLIERVLQTEQNVLQINLTEALSIAPKLSAKQLDILTIALLSKLTFFNEYEQYSYLIDYLETKVCPFSKEYAYEPIDYIHLEYLRCLYKLHSNGLEDPLTSKLISEPKLMRYFANGATIEQVIERFGDINHIDKILTESYHDSSKLQLITYDPVKFNKILIDNKITFTKDQNFYWYFTAGGQLMGDGEIKKILKQEIPCIEKVFRSIERLNDFKLYPLGIVIAQANYKRRMGNTLDISQLII